MSDPSLRPAPLVDRARRRLESLEAAGVAGILFAVLFPLSALLVNDAPGVETTQAEVDGWYSDPDRRRSVVYGFSVAPFACIAFVWFVVVVRRRIGDREDRFLGTALLASAVLFVALFGVSVALVAANAVVVDAFDVALPSLEAHQLAQAMGRSLFFGFGIRFAGLFVLVLATMARRARALRLWVSPLGYLAGIAMLVSASFWPAVAAPLPLWLLLVSVMILIRAGRLRSTEADAGPGDEPTRP